jgi:hypothetical protein
MGSWKLFLGALIAGISIPAQASPLPRYGTFVFSGLCTEPQTGRMIGSRLTVTRLNHGDKAYYEWSDLFEPGKNLNPYPGAKPQSPASFGRTIVPGLKGADAVTVRIEPSGHIVANFDPRDRQSPRTVAGDLSENGFSLSGYEASLWLPRQQERGGKIPVCDMRPPKLPVSPLPPPRSYFPVPKLQAPNLPKQ